MIVEINNLQSLLNIDESRVQREIMQVLFDEGFSRVDVSGAIIDNSEIHRLKRSGL